MIQSKIKTSWLVVAAVMLFCFMFVSLRGVTAVTAAESEIISEMRSVSAENIASVSAIAVGATEKMYVYDADENQLMYNRVTGMVFSDAGVVFNHDSQPLTYNDETQEFEDSLQRRLDLVERSTHGLKNYYLMFGSYKVRSIGIHDELYIAKIKGKTKLNSGDAYEILVTRVYVKYSFWDWQWLAGRYGYYEYYDLNTHKIADEYLDFEYRPSLLAGAGTSSFGGGLVAFEKWGTILDLLDEIIYLMELVPPSGVMGEFALNTVTGAYLRDDRIQKIRIKDGQLIDPMGWPLIGSDARPLWWREDIRAYTNHKGELLEYGDGDTLIEKNGFMAHSVISDVIAGKRIYLVYINIKTSAGAIDPSKSGKYLIPATAKTIFVDPYEAEFYDMNGKLVPEWELIEPEVSVDDRKENWPEEFESGCLGIDWQNILMILALILLLIILIPVLPAIISFLITVVLWLVKGVVWIVTAPFKAIGNLSKKKSVKQTVKQNKNNSKKAKQARYTTKITRK